MSTTIGDIYTAINDKLIVGKFSENRTVFNFDQITYKDSRGKVHQWQINVELLEDGIKIPIHDRMIMQPVYKFDTPINDKLGNFTPKPIHAYSAKIYVISSIVDGKVRDSADDFVTEGKNIGKKNETNMLTQAFKDAASKLKTHIKNKDLISSNPTHLTTQSTQSMQNLTISDKTFYPPMLLTRINTNKSSTWGQPVYDNEGVYFQPKFNGHRCITFMNSDKKIVMYSRTMKEYKIDYLSEIINSTFGAEGVFKYGEHNLYIDGELYSHGLMLQDISSLVRNEQDIDKSKLKFYIFDIFIPGMPHITYVERLDIINKIKKIKHDSILFVDTIKIKNETEANEMAEKYISDGYEGGVIRRGGGIYEYGYNNKHSTNVLKVKLILDSEFIISGYNICAKGTHAGQIVWVLKNEGGLEFKVSMKNITAVQNKKLAEQIVKSAELFENFKEKYVNVEYAELSADGIPLQAKATNIFKHPHPAPENEAIYSELNSLYTKLLNA